MKRIAFIISFLLLFAGIADPASTIYVDNGNGNNVLNWPIATTGNVAPTIATCTSGCGSGFSGVALDGSGALWVADFGNNKVYKLSGLSGNVSASVTIGGASTLLASPYGGICFDSSGNLWVLNLNGHALQFSAANLVSGGNVAPTINITPGQNGSSRGLGCDAIGNIYIASDASSDIQTEKWNISGIKQWENDSGNVCSTVAGMTVDLGNNVYVVCQSGNQIVRYNSGYCTTGTCSANANSSTTTNVSTPAGISADHSNNVYIVNFGDNSVRVYSTGASFVNIASIVGGSTTLSSPQWIFVSDPTSTPTATVTATTTPTPTMTATPTATPTPSGTFGNRGVLGVPDGIMTPSAYGAVHNNSGFQYNDTSDASGVVGP